MPEQQHGEIRRRDNIPDSLRTQGKDDAALEIESHIENGNWPMTPSELAENSSWSRSHMRNVLDQYFEPVGEAEEREPETRERRERVGRGHEEKMDVDVRPGAEAKNARAVEIEIPPEVTNSIDYMRGYINGRADAEMHQ